jgi:recombination protein RecA
MEVRRIGAVKEGDVVIGSRTRVKVVKNKMAPPFREAEFDLLYGSGIARAAELVDLGAAHGLIEKSGAWYAMAGGGERIGQGRDRAAEYLRNNAALAQHIEQQLHAIKDDLIKLAA